MYIYRIKCLNLNLFCHFYFQRFAREDKLKKLPKWIQSNMSKGVLNLSIEESTQITRKFLKQMAQPFSKVSQESNQIFFPQNFKNFYLYRRINLVFRY